MYAEHEAAMAQAINDPMSRRHFLWKNGVGLGGIALTCMLQEEAAAEGEHKAWCDGELKENKLTRDAKTEEVAAPFCAL